jgi:hypothetical protein
VLIFDWLIPILPAQEAGIKGYILAKTIFGEEIFEIQPLSGLKG